MPSLYSSTTVAPPPNQTTSAAPEILESDGDDGLNGFEGVKTNSSHSSGRHAHDKTLDEQFMMANGTENREFDFSKVFNVSLEGDDDNFTVRNLTSWVRCF